MNSKVKKYSKKALKVLGILGVSMILCSLALIIVFSLPEERIRMHIARASNIIFEEGNYPYLGAQTEGCMLDNYTDALLFMFNYSADSEHPIESAFIARGVAIPSVEGVDTLKVALEDPNWKELLGGDRSSNWLGINIILRPMLFLFDINQCRIVWNIICYIILAITICVIAKKINSYIALGYAVTMWTFGFYATSLSFSLGGQCIIIANIAICYILSKNLRNINIFNTMLYVGILTAFFDWLSIPLVTWGLPILIYYIVLTEKNNAKLHIAALVKSGFGWCIGYAGMICSKCIIAVMLQGKEGWNYFVNRITADTAGNSIEMWLLSIRKMIDCIFPFNLFPSNNLIFTVGWLAIILLIIISASICGWKKRFGMLCLIGLSPFAYYAYARGHIHHTGIEFRTLMITFYTIWIVIESSIQRVKQCFLKKHID